MRILQLCTKVPFPSKDGGAAAVIALSASLNRLGHQVEILAVNSAKHYVSNIETGLLPFKIHSIYINTTPTVWGALSSLFSGVPYHVSRFSSPAFSSKLISLLTENTYNIVQIEGAYLCSYIPLIRKYSKAKIVLRAHNVEHVLWKSIAANEKRFLYKQYLYIQAKRLKNFEVSQLRLVDGIVAIAETDELFFQQHSNKVPLTTVPYGIEPSAFINANGVYFHSLFYIGALDWIPNQEGLLWFLENVWGRCSNPMLQFHVAGRNAPQWLANKLINTRRVTFHGEVESSTEFMLRYNIMVVPLLSGSGIRVKIIEAMNLGKPIIATPIACQGISAIHGKHLFIAGSPNEFVNTIGNVLENSEMLTGIGEEAHRFVNEKYNVLTLTAGLVKFYEHILQ